MSKRIEIECSLCKKIRLVDTRGMLAKTYQEKYKCCRKCSRISIMKKISKTWFRKGSKPWNTGILGDYLPHWRGDNVTKDSLHDWVERHAGRPQECTFCGKTTGKFQWSNISGEYKRELSDYQRLCVKCHCKYDFEKFGARKEFYNAK